MAAGEDEGVAQGAGEGWWGQATEGAGLPLLWASGDHLLPRLWGQGSELTFPEALSLLLELRVSGGHLMKPTTLSGHRIAQT